MWHYWFVLAHSELVQWETRSNTAEPGAVSGGGWEGALEVLGLSPAHSRDDAKARQLLRACLVVSSVSPGMEIPHPHWAPSLVCDHPQEEEFISNT